jgi:triphosphoribosyl-dephospho-CoA synthase
VLPALVAARGGGASWGEAAVAGFLETLAVVPDTLIARKEGDAAARAVSARAKIVAGVPAIERPAALAAFDAELRQAGGKRNPGATADLVAAGLYVALISELGEG